MNWLINLFQSTVFQTVISGVLIFTIGQIIQRFFLKPIQKYKATIGKIDNKLKFYANVIANPGTWSKENTLQCLNKLRQLSCDLETTYKQLLFKRKDRTIKIADSASRLIRLSNSLGPGNNFIHNDEDVEKIRENLGIPKL